MPNEENKMNRSQRFSTSIRERFLDRVLRIINSQDDLSIQLDITARCNLKCSHCYQNPADHAATLTLDDWKRVVDQYAGLLQRLRLRPSVSFCGGEPLTSPILVPLARYVVDVFPGVPLAVLTNGTLLSPQVVADLAGLDITFQISVDGPDAERNDAIRGPGAFDRAVAGIGLLVAEKVPVTMQTVLSQRSAPWISESFALASNLGVAHLSFARMVVQGHAAELRRTGQDGPLGREEMKVAIATIIAEARRTGISTDTHQPLYGLVDKNVGKNGKFGFQGLVVDHRGQLKVTSRSPVVLGDVLKEGLADLFLGHPVMKRLRQCDIEGCGDCPRYRECGGDRNAAFAEFGDFFKPDPACFFAGRPIVGSGE